MVADLPRKRGAPAGAKAALGAVWVTLALLLAGCVTYRGAPAESAQQPQQIEALLTAAGFKPVFADTAQKMEILHGLPPHEIRHYPTKNGMVFWYADPDDCRCVYEGDQKAYQQFELLRLQQQELDEYEQAAMTQQGTMLYAFNPLWFGMPMFLPLPYAVGVPSKGQAPAHPAPERAAPAPPVHVEPPHLMR
jgi:hypothetical protein